MPEVIIDRYNHKKDVEQVVKIERERYKDPFLRGQLYFYSQKYDTSLSFVLRKAKEVIGHVFTVIDAPLQAHIYSIAISKEEEGNGYGTLLLRELKRHAAARSMKIVLEVRLSNMRAIHLYLKQGFVETGIIEDYYADGESALQMEWDC